MQIPQNTPIPKPCRPVLWSAGLGFWATNAQSSFHLQLGCFLGRVQTQGLSGHFRETLAGPLSVPCFPELGAVILQCVTSMALMVAEEELCVRVTHSCWHRLRAWLGSPAGLGGSGLLLFEV